MKRVRHRLCDTAGRRRFGYVALIVRDDDEAIAYHAELLGLRRLSAVP